jgi:hypothetical protein
MFWRARKMQRNTAQSRKNAAGFVCLRGSSDIVFCASGPAKRESRLAKAAKDRWPGSRKQTRINKLSARSHGGAFG